MGSEDVNSLRGAHTVKNITLRWVEDFIIENSTQEQFNHTGWIHGATLAPEVDNDHVSSMSFTLILGTLLMLFAIPSNTAIFLITSYRIWREPKFRSMHLFSCSLAIADIFVSTWFLPTQAGWITTSPWEAGEVACKTYAFFRIFGRYLSAFIVICISVDRTWPVLTPTNGSETSKKAIVMVSLALVAATALSSYEAILYHVNATWRKECTIFGSFASKEDEMAYTVIQTILLCILPLIAILVCYGTIFWKMCRSQGETAHRPRANILACTKTQTVILYLMIILTFFISWTPPVVVKLWFWLDIASAVTVDQEVWKVLLLFESTSACFHPIISSYLQLKRN